MRFSLAALTIATAALAGCNDSQPTKPNQPIVVRSEAQDRLHKLGYDPVGSSGAELAAAQRTDLQRWEKPIKATGVQLD